MENKPKCYDCGKAETPLISVPNFKSMYGEAACSGCLRLRENRKREGR